MPECQNEGAEDCLGLGGIMGRLFWRWSVFASLAILAGPATATRWVQTGQFDWIDTDSIVRANDGSGAMFLTFHGATPPTANAEVGHRGFNCKTRRDYWWENGRLVPVPEQNEDDVPAYVSESDPQFQLVCRIGD
jgi:hypothetical protein